MLIWRRQLRALSRVALVAILALALLPTVSRALAFLAGPTPWTEVCAGSRPVARAAGSDDPTGAPERATAPLAHCPLCTLASAALGLPPAPAQLAAPGAGDGSVRAIATQASPPVRVWRAALARAPPASV